MTRDEAIANAIKAAEEAESYLHRSKPDLAYSWSVLADTWASIARAIDPELDEDSDLFLVPITRTTSDTRQPEM